MLKKISMLTLCGVSAFALNYAEINVNDSDLELSGKLDMGQMIHSVTPNTVFLGLKFLDVDAKHSENDNAKVKSYGEVNFLMQKEIARSGLTIGLGIKLNKTELNDKSFMSAPLGIEARYKIPASDYIPMYIGGTIYHAPTVLSFEDAENYMEYRAHFDLEVIQNGCITLGYRSIDTNYDTYNFNYNKSVFVGFKFGF
ncbi:MAG: YfaZ family outer membrane protein [Sulfurimonas sp.]|nr:YfaZ family outer membrane protein [Sulfurimonas sp.]